MQHQFAPVGSNLEHKLQLYSAAVYLFDKGKSHPQIVRKLSEYESDPALLNPLVDKAMREDWDKLFEYSRQLFADGITYDEVIVRMSEMEEDKEVVIFLCNKWYEWKTELLEHIHEGPDNILQGALWVILCGGMVAMQFIYKWHLISKIIWIAALVASIIQFIAGLMQKRAAKNIRYILNTKVTDHK